MFALGSIGRYWRIGRHQQLSSGEFVERQGKRSGEDGEAESRACLASHRVTRSRVKRLEVKRLRDGHCFSTAPRVAGAVAVPFPSTGLRSGAGGGSAASRVPFQNFLRLASTG